MAVILWKTIPVLLVLLMLWCLYAHILRLLAGSRIKYKRAVALGGGALILLPAVNLWSSFYLLVIVLHFCAFALVFDAVDWVVRRFRTPEPRLWRRLHKWLVPPLLCTAAAVFLGYANICDVRETQYTVTTAKPLRPEGWRFALLADVHYGLLDNKGAMQRLADSLSERNLDFVVLCGDITDERSSLQEVQDICRILGGVRTKQGVYYVFGNHDTARYSHHAEFTRQDLVDALRGNGITILEDDTVALGGDILLTGRQDKSYPRMPVEDLLKGADPSRYLIVADHQPYELAQKAAAGVDLQVSGHTHSGQFFPVGYICRALHIGDLNYGHARIGGMDAIVTSGVTGWGAPMRTQGHAEYVIVNIRPQTSSQGVPEATP